MDDQDNNLQDENNRGQEDASEGKYNPPHTVIPIADDLLYGKETVDKMNEENEAYNTGWSHGHKQS
jgi:hypothetical protein